MTKHPPQRVHIDEHGVRRFVQNDIVRHLIDNGSIDLNQLARMNFSDEDWSQLAQLIGYSVSGYGDLSYCNRRQQAAAQKKNIK